MMFFATRSQARNFANGRKIVDMGVSPQGVTPMTKRWGVKVLIGF